MFSWQLVNYRLKKGNHWIFQWLEEIGGSAVKNLTANTGDTVRSLVQEDSTCHGAAKPMGHNYWSLSALVPTSLNYWACELQQPTKPVRLESVLCNKRSHRSEKPVRQRENSSRSPQLEKALVEHRRLSVTKNKINK